MKKDISEKEKTLALMRDLIEKLKEVNNVPYKLIKELDAFNKKESMKKENDALFGLTVEIPEDVFNGDRDRGECHDAYHSEIVEVGSESAAVDYFLRVIIVDGTVRVRVGRSVNQIFSGGKNEK